MNFFRLCIGGNRWIGLAVDQIEKHLLHLAFTKSADLYHLGSDDTGLFSLNIRADLLFKHGIHFARRAWKQDCNFSVFLHCKTRSRAIVVFKNNSSFRNQGLSPIAFRQFAFHPQLVPFFKMGFYRRVFHQAGPHYLCTDLFCDIILGRAKSPVQDNHVCPVKRSLYDTSHSLPVVAYRRLIIYRQTQHGAFFREVTGICINDITKQQFRPHGNQFNNHL